MSKYHAVATTVDNIRFDSKREAERYRELKLLDRAKHIAFLALQPTYALHSVNLDTGEIVHVANYKPDFTYTDLKTNQIVVEDVKGFRNSTYVLKKKLVEAEYGIHVVEVR